MKLDNEKTSILPLITLRGILLINITLLRIIGIDKELPVLLIVVILYYLLLVLFWRKAADLIKKNPLLLLLDLTISGILVGITGGSWASPYYLYSLTNIVFASFFLRIRDTLASTGYLTVLYIINTVINGHAVSESAMRQNLDMYILSCLVFSIIAIFFGYPAHIIRKTEEIQRETTLNEECLRETKELVAAIADPNQLSCRELEVLSCLSKGKTNLQIAEELFISEKTVKNHLHRIYKKLKISSREEAILYYHANNTPG